MQAFIYIGKFAIMGQDKWERALAEAPKGDAETLAIYDKLGGFIAEVVEVETEDEETGEISVGKDFRKVKTGRFWDFKKDKAKDLSELKADLTNESENEDEDESEEDDENVEENGSDEGDEEEAKPAAKKVAAKKKPAAKKGKK